jgi:hypothetical protein
MKIAILMAMIGFYAERFRLKRKNGKEDKTEVERRLSLNIDELTATYSAHFKQQYFNCYTNEEDRQKSLQRIQKLVEEKNNHPAAYQNAKRAFAIIKKLSDQGFIFDHELANIADMHTRARTAK